MMHWRGGGEGWRRRGGWTGERERREGALRPVSLSCLAANLQVTSTERRQPDTGARPSPSTSPPSLILPPLSTPAPPPFSPPTPLLPLLLLTVLPSASHSSLFLYHTPPSPPSFLPSFLPPFLLLQPLALAFPGNVSNWYNYIHVYSDAHRCRLFYPLYPLVFPGVHVHVPDPNPGGLGGCDGPDPGRRGRLVGSCSSHLLHPLPLVCHPGKIPPTHTLEPA